MVHRCRSGGGNVEQNTGRRYFQGELAVAESRPLVFGRVMHRPWGHCQEQNPTTSGKIGVTKI